MADASPLRLRRVRFKDGRTIEVLRPKHEDVATRMRQAVILAIDDDPGWDCGLCAGGVAL